MSEFDFNEKDEDFIEISVVKPKLKKQKIQHTKLAGKLIIDNVLTNESVIDENSKIQQNSKVAYIHSDEYVKIADFLPINKGRAKLIHGLIAAYELLDELEVKNPIPASNEDLEEFHSSDYVQFLLQNEDKEISNETKSEDFGLVFDCPSFTGYFLSLNSTHRSVYKHVSWIAGASITAAQELINGRKIAVNWHGGRHHAQKDEASGFCYVNDIVISILKLMNSFNKILYIDIDVHHGDGVENAFRFSNRVFTLSFHKFIRGFFPGTGSLTNEESQSYLNVPLDDGIDDATYIPLFKYVFELVMQHFKPNAIVFQCGADALAGDPLGGFNLTQKSYGECLKNIKEQNLPMLVLGGGGYNHINTAKCWTYLMSILVGKEISKDIPEHDYFMKYGPDFSLEIKPCTMNNLNTPERIEEIKKIIKGKLEDEDSEDSEDED